MSEVYRGSGEVTEYGLPVGEWGTHDVEQWFYSGKLEGIDLSTITGSDKQLAWVSNIILKRYNDVKNNYQYSDLNIFAARAYEIEINTAIRSGKLKSAKQVIDNRYEFTKEFDILQMIGVNYEHYGYVYNMESGTWTKTDSERNIM